MSDTDRIRAISQAVGSLSEPSSLKGLSYRGNGTAPLPSGEELGKFVELCRAVLFPGFYGRSSITFGTVNFHIGVAVEKLYGILAAQVDAGLGFAGGAGGDERRERARDIAAGLVASLPRIRWELAADVDAAYLGDPAAGSHAEVIACYPGVKAITNYRIAHELHLRGVPLIPRMITEMAHAATGIDIHPGAEIGGDFSIDHGTGVVIGATCVIGDRVKLYQGVTLGAKSFPLDGDGNPIKGVLRHPLIGNDVVVYANATVLGRVKIGDGCVVGANVWVTEDMPPGTQKARA